MKLKNCEKIRKYNQIIIEQKYTNPKNKLNSKYGASCCFTQKKKKKKTNKKINKKYKIKSRHTESLSINKIKIYL